MVDRVADDMDRDGCAHSTGITVIVRLQYDWIGARRRPGTQGVRTIGQKGSIGKIPNGEAGVA